MADARTVGENGVALDRKSWMVGLPNDRHEHVRWSQYLAGGDEYVAFPKDVAEALEHLLRMARRHQLATGTSRTTASYDLWRAVDAVRRLRGKGPLDA